ncbi:MAG: hypothetical protein ACLFQK_09390 [Fibrobacterota bacterium]
MKFPLFFLLTSSFGLILISIISLRDSYEKRREKINEAEKTASESEKKTLYIYLISWIFILSYIFTADYYSLIPRYSLWPIVLLKASVSYLEFRIIEYGQEYTRLIHKIDKTDNTVNAALATLIITGILTGGV